jgi:hypothetical protein
MLIRCQGAGFPARMNVGIENNTFQMKMKTRVCRFFTVTIKITAKTIAGAV